MTKRDKNGLQNIPMSMFIIYFLIFLFLTSLAHPTHRNRSNVKFQWVGGFVNHRLHHDVTSFSQTKHDASTQQHLLLSQALTVMSQNRSTTDKCKAPGLDSLLQTRCFVYYPITCLFSFSKLKLKGDCQDRKFNLNRFPKHIYPGAGPVVI